MSEQQKILEMIEKGQITAAEGMELLEALNSHKDTVSLQTPVSFTQPSPYKYKFLKIKVTSDNNTINVNVNIPIRLITTVGEIAAKATALIPADARKDMEMKGIDITSIDFASIIKDLLEGTLDDPSIVDVEAWDEQQKAMIKVHIYVE